MRPTWTTRSRLWRYRCCKLGHRPPGSSTYLVAAMFRLCNNRPLGACLYTRATNHDTIVDRACSYFTYCSTFCDYYSLFRCLVLVHAFLIVDRVLLSLIGRFCTRWLCIASRDASVCVAALCASSFDPLHLRSSRVYCEFA